MTIYIIIAAMVGVYYVVPLAIWAPELLDRRIKFCCFVRPWCAHFTYDGWMEGDLDAWAGMFFCVTDSTIYEYELPSIIAHEVRHVLHGIILGVLYDVMYSNFETFERWAERDCERAEKKPILHRARGRERKKTNTSTGEAIEESVGRRTEERL